MESEDIGRRPADPFVRDAVPGEGPSHVIAGLLGDSDLEGHRRLYLNTRLDYYVEFAVGDVRAVASVAPDEFPFPGLEATRVSLAPDAVLRWTRRRPAADLQGFALEARADRTVQPQFTETWEARCPGVTEHFGESAFSPCRGGGGTGAGAGTGPTTTGPFPVPTRDHGVTCGRTDVSCDTCAGPSCQTCRATTCVSAVTCGTCGEATCGRGCTDGCGGFGPSGAATCEGSCASCNVTCDASCFGTCADATCLGTCGRDSCHTCDQTCPPTCDTCVTCIGCFTERWTNCMASCECR